MYKENFFSKRKLKGIRVWISGAVPESEYWPHSLYDRDILQFVALFTRLVLKRGGAIVHGSHPSFTPVLLNQLSLAKLQSNKQLSLYVSEIWKDVVLNKYSDLCDIKVVDQVLNDQQKTDINKSLTALRHEMAQSSDVIVVLGGKIHANGEREPGIVEEVRIAQQYGLKCFILPNFYGASKLFDTHTSSLKIDLDEIDLDVLGHKLIKKMESLYHLRALKFAFFDIAKKVLKIKSDR